MKCTHIPVSLFLVCRAWSEDAINAFYSENAYGIGPREVPLLDLKTAAQAVGATIPDLLGD